MATEISIWLGTRSHRSHLSGALGTGSTCIHMTQILRRSLWSRCTILHLSAHVNVECKATDTVPGIYMEM